MKPKLSIVVPCYNVPNLLENVLKIIEEVKNITNDYEIILIDDGSDNFIYITQNDYIKVITHKQNKGKGEALVSGFKEARGEIIAFIDADLQIPAWLLKPYYEIMKGGRSPSILVGSKRHFNSRIYYPFIRRLYSFGFQIVSKYLFGLSVLDSQGGLKMFRKEVIKNILPKLSIKKFAIDLEILVAANENNYTILEAPIQINHSFKSTVNLKAVWRMVWDTFYIWHRKKFRKRYKGGGQ